MTWRNRATCLGEDPELFFPIGSTGPALVQIEEAKAICRRCEVVDTCLRWAMETGADTGVWGGLSDDERRSLKRRRARARVLSLVVGGQGRQRDPRLEGRRPGPALPVKVLGAALDEAATVARELQQALPAPAAAGYSR